MPLHPPPKSTIQYYTLTVRLWENRCSCTLLSTNGSIKYIATRATPLVPIYFIDTPALSTK